jgi:glycosyltransferase involved in cell wall biosynthesis
MEGFGLPVAEAMAAGAPVIATALGPIREFAGEAPLYIEVGDVDALAGHIATLRDDPAVVARCQAAGREVAQGLRWTAVAEATAEVIAAARSGHAAR